jgi:signal transduction histidine kinase/CheY-like chemotaxis protein
MIQGPFADKQMKPASLAVVLVLISFSIFVWMSVLRAVNSDVNSKLENEVEHIESDISQYSLALYRALINFSSLEGSTSRNGAQVASSSNAILAAIEKKTQLQASRDEFRDLIFGMAQLEGALGLKPRGESFPQEASGAKIRLVVQSALSAGEIAKEFSGLELLGLPSILEAVTKSTLTGLPAWSLETEIASQSGARGRSGFFLVSSFFAKNKRPPEQSLDIRNLAGVNFIFIESGQFFRHALSVRTRLRDRIDFEIYQNNSTGENPIYISKHENVGFLPNIKRLNREIEIFGRNFEVRAFARPALYALTAVYLPSIIGFGLLLLCGLVLVVLLFNEKQIALNSDKNLLLAREASIRTENAARLARLNRLMVESAVRPRFEDRVDLLFQSVSEEANVDLSLIYFSDDNQIDKSYPLKRSYWTFSPFKPLTAIPPASLSRFFKTQEAGGSIRSSMLDTSDAGIFLQDPPEFKSLVLFRLPANDLNFGCFWLFGKTGETLDASTLELLENMVGFSAVAIKNSLLLRNAESASLSKSAFLANMGHEVRTPLNAIVGFSEMLCEKSADPEARAELEQHIKKNARQLTQIVDDILDLTKVEAGKLSIQKRRFGVGAFLYIKSTMEKLAKEKGLSLKIESKGEIPSSIYSDELRLKQILTNLLSNAMKFSEFGSVQLIVKFDAPEAAEKINNGDVSANEQTVTTENGRLNFHILDSGIGMSKKVKDSLFTPFVFAPDVVQSRKYGGSGLGLLLSRHLSHELGGDLVLVRSEEGHGSEFKVSIDPGDMTGVKIDTSLDVRFDGLKKSLAARGDSMLLAGSKILLVEDSLDNQEIFSHFLESDGAVVKIVDSGIAAIEAVRDEKFDIVLMDIQINGINGLEATRRIRADGYLGPILAVTAHAMAEDIENSLSAGCNGQITKPVGKAKFISTVKSFLTEDEWKTL